MFARRCGCNEFGARVNSSDEDLCLMSGRRINSRPVLIRGDCVSVVIGRSCRLVGFLRFVGCGIHGVCVPVCDSGVGGPISLERRPCTKSVLHVFGRSGSASSVSVGVSGLGRFGGCGGP